MIPTDMSKASTGRRIEILRNTLNPGNASAFARRVGWTASQLKNYENGDQLPRMDQLEKLYLATLVGFDFIFRGDLSSTPEGLATRIRQTAQEMAEGDRQAG